MFFISCGNYTGVSSSRCSANRLFHDIDPTDPLNALSVNCVLDEAFPSGNKLASDSDCEALFVDLKRIGIKTVGQLRNALQQTVAVALARKNGRCVEGKLSPCT